MQLSHSRVEAFVQCRFKYKLRYVDRLKTIPNTDADNALILGTALHTGIEKSVGEAVEFYKSQFPMITDVHIDEIIKLEALIPKAAQLLPDGGVFELTVCNDEFIGYLDYLVPVGPDQYDLYDFKYSSNTKRYRSSGQLHEYKYYFELTHAGMKIRNMYFLIIPKVRIRQKKTETLNDFRWRLREKCQETSPELLPIEYDPGKVEEFLLDAKLMVECCDFTKNETHLCEWCEYQEYCEKGYDYMILPSNKRRDLSATKKKVIWIYGAPFSGKTYFANEFPDPLMLNTDGNIKFVDSPYISIRDEVTVEGRLTKRKLAYEVFTEAVEELEKKQNEFKTIVVDLLEDVYEACRVYICDRQGWKHESDDSFRAWDMVRSEFLNTLKRLVNLDYDNIILISHEDRTRDITRKSGDKISAVKPNLQDKVANKVAGMVDLVARVVADDGVRVLSFKASETTFGGGRLQVKSTEIPLEYGAFCGVYDEANSGVHTESEPTPEPAVVEPAPEPIPEPQEAPKRTRKRRESDV